MAAVECPIIAFALSFQASVDWPVVASVSIRPTRKATEEGNGDSSDSSGEPAICAHC